MSKNKRDRTTRRMFNVLFISGINIYLSFPDFHFKGMLFLHVKELIRQKPLL